MSSPYPRPEELHSYSDELRRQEEFCDVIMKVQNRSFPCHRIILASSVRYFRNMFTQKYSEADKKEIELKGFSADDFELLLTHIYGGAVCLNDNNAYRLLRISHYLNMKSLEDSCTNYLVNSKSIPLNAAICIFLFACRIGETSIVEEFTERMAENFVSLSKNEKFLRISGSELLKILSHPSLSADSASILDSLTEWMKCQSAENRTCLPDLLNAVHLNNVPNEWLVKTISENTISSNRFKDKKRKKREEISHSSTHSSENSTVVDQLFFDSEMDDLETPRHQDEMKLPFILYTHDVRNGGEYFINRYKFKTVNSFCLLKTDRDPEIEYDKVEFCKTALVDNVHIMMMINHDPVSHDDNGSSGYTSTSDSDSDSPTPSVRHSSRCKFSFNPYLYNESDIHGMQSRHETGKDDYSCATMATCGVKLYVYSAGQFRTFDCQNNEWINGPRDVPVKTMYPSLLSYNDCLYMVGGKRSTRRFDGYASKDYRNGKFLQHYDLREGKWTRLPRMKYAHNQSACCIHNDILYVSGGAFLTYFKKYIECFDLKAGKWFVFETPMLEPKMDHTLIAHNNQLWFFGGKKYKSGSNAVTADLTWFSYDLKESKWSNIYSVPKTHGDFTTQKIFDVVVEI